MASAKYRVLRAAKRDVLSRNGDAVRTLPVHRNMRRTVVSIVTLLASSAAFAQQPGLGDTRPVDPAARDEASAEIRKPPAPPSAPERAQSDNDRASSRCAELADTARDECLREERSASAGATRRAEPPSAPPPQNPR